MAENAKKNTAFICKKGLYQYLYMPFGLRSNPNAFSRFMQTAFSDLLWKNMVLCIDDIIIFSSDLANHIKTLRNFLERCLELHLKINVKKCDFLKSKVIYLGHVVSHEGIEPNPAKVEIIKNHPTPKSKKQLQSFMGLINYYRKFIPNIAHLGIDRKFANKFEGPFEILAQISAVNYVIKSVAKNKIDTVHVNRMKLLVDSKEERDRVVQEMFSDTDSE